MSHPSSRDLLIRGATVLSVDPAVGDLERGDVLVRGEVIAAVGPDLRAQAMEAEVLDATGMIAVPGFVDSHVHAWEGQLRGLAPVVDFAGYLGITAFGHGPRYRPDDVYAGTLSTALTALDAGITTIVDNSHNALTPEHSDAAVRALLDAGIRGVHAIGSPFGAALDHVPSTALGLRERYAATRVSVRLFEVSPSVGMWEFARDAGFWVSTELGPHTPGLAELFEELHTRKLLTAQHAFNHCYDLPDRVWELIGGSGAAVNLCPRSDAAFGLGSAVPPVAQALRYAAAVGLSNDNEISYGIDMFAEMQTLQSRHRGEAFRRLAGGEAARTDELTPARLLEFATAGGAANAGLADQVGSLTPGKQADIVLIDTTRRPALPPADPTGAVTLFAGVGDVDTVL
ncbi:MAG: 5-methylthioadenosine/S-adenosylhomocysteine deaminase, partial [Pseudonocardiales bacterium]|nr:5-methylthioadenosine/S-adenosylhomocysteine deaminase [Pseudonocardiales bacterium]